MWLWGLHWAAPKIPTLPGWGPGSWPGGIGSQGLAVEIRGRMVSQDLRYIVVCNYIYIYIEDLTLMVTGNHMKHTNTIFRKTCVSIGTWIFDLTCLLYGTITGRFMVPTSSQIVWSSGQSATQAVRLQQESCRSIKECEGKQTAKWWVSPDWTMFNYRKKNDFLHLGMPRNCEYTLKLHFSFGRWCDKALDFGVPYLWTNPWTSGLGCKSTSSLMPLEILKWLRGYVISPKEGGFSCQCW